MKTEIEADDIKRIAEAVVMMMKPYLNQNQDNDEEELMDIDGVSKMLGKSKGQIYQWVHNSSHGVGGFPFMKAGKSLRFSRKAITEWITSP